MVGNSVWAIRVHLAVGPFEVQLQAARKLEVAAHWHLCGKHAGMHN